MQIRIDPSAQTGAPCITASNVNIYVYGSSFATGKLVYVKDTLGNTAPVTGNVPPLAFYGGSFTTGNASQVIQLPNLNSARVYMSVNGPLAVNPPNGLPTPWNAVPGTQFTPIFDWFEYTLPANGLPSPSIDINSTQIQMIGLDYTIQLNGTQYNGAQQSGLLAGFMTAVHNYSFPAGSPWPAVMFAQWNLQGTSRILGPNAVQYSPGGNPSLIGFVSPSGVNPPAGEFTDPQIQTAWETWKAPNCLKIVYNAQLDGINPSANPVWGQVNGNDDFVFYDPNVIMTCAQLATTPNPRKVTTLPSPFNQSYWISSNQQGSCLTATGWFTATSSVLLQNGPFIAPATLNTCTSGVPGTVSYPENTSYPHLSAAIGNIVSTAINRGLLSNPVNDQAQPECNGINTVYTGNAPYQNLYATALWSAVHAGLTLKGSGIYAIPYDDQCKYSSDLVDSGAQSIIVTIYGN